MESLISIGLSITLAIVLFLALRSVMLWYWKIPEMIKHQKEQIRLLKKMVDEKSDGLTKDEKELVEKLR